MKTFQEWHDELISDTRWYEQVSMKYKGTFKTACEKLYGMSVSDPDLFSRPIQAQRKHLFNMLWSMPVEKKNWVQTHQVEDKKEEKPFVPASDEHVAKCVAEFHKILEEAPNWHISRVKPSKRMEEELGEVRVRSTHYHLSDVEMRIQAIENVRNLQRIRRKTFLEAYPDATGEEIEAYVEKWSEVDNPNKLPV